LTCGPSSSVLLHNLDINGSPVGGNASLRLALQD